MPASTTPLPTVSIDPPAPIAEDIASRWMLDPSIAFLNHGCFGARLRAVSEAQSRYRDRYESRPVEFLDRKLDRWIPGAKSALGAFAGMKPDDFGFVTNATDGVNAVMRSLTFAAGDEILTTSHVYNAVRQTMSYLAERAGGSSVVLDVPVPLAGPEDVVDAVESALTARTRLVVLDHVTSATAIRFPIERLVETCQGRGVDVLVDGAHVPGMLPLDIEALGAAYYAGNLHKWVGAPSGAGFIWVRPDRQEGVHPTVISHFLGEGLAPEFAWQGTRDITPWLAVQDALEQMDALAGPNSWPRIMDHNHRMAVWVQAMLCAAWDVEPLTPLDGSMLGSMVSVPLPAEAMDRFETPEAMHDRLYDEYALEAPVIDWGQRWLVRPCCQVYNTPEHYERLARAVLALVESS